MKNRGLAIILTAILTVGALAGCGNSTGGESGTGDKKADAAVTAAGQVTEAVEEGKTAGETVTNTEIKYGGNLNIGIRRENTHDMLNFDMTGASDDYFYSWPVYESLFKPNAEGTVDPWLLEDYSYDIDALTYTFNIRKGITFSDGTVFDAEALKWNLDHYLKVGAKVKALLSSIDSVEATDEYTVVLHLNTWSSIIPYAFSRECGYVMSPSYFEKNGEDYCKEHPCGTGPFTLTEWNRDVSKTFTKREDYWGGKVRLDTITYTIYSDELVETAALESGEIDAILAPSAEQADALAAEGYEIKTCAVKSHSYLLCFNSLNQNGDDPTGDLKVRQAICHAIDFEALDKAVWGDYGSFRNQFGVGEHYYNKDVQGYDYNPELAKQLLAEAGYPNGFETEIKTEDSTALSNAATIMQQYLAEVGIKAEISILSGADANKAEEGWGNGLWIHGSSVYVSVPMQMASMFRKNLDGHVLGLSELLRPDDVDECLAKSVAASNEEEAVKEIGEANKLLTDKYCIIYNFAEVGTMFVVNDYVKDSGIGDVFYSVADLSNAWIDK